MSALAWSPELALDHERMDATHEEFVALLAQTDAALTLDDATLLARWTTLCDHTVEHFGQEDRWMQATGFAPENCHAFQHKAVLDVMLECGKRAREEGDFEPLRVAVGELAIWFPQHAQQMDAALAQHMALVGFDPETGECKVALDANGEPILEPITGCGGSSCS